MISCGLRLVFLLQATIIALTLQSKPGARLQQQQR